MRLHTLPLVLLLIAGAATVAAQRHETPKFAATLHAAAETVAPGGQVDLALRFDIEEHWHLYHPILLEAGIAPSIRFEVPEGISFGPLRYPAPAYGEMAGFGYLGFEGRPVVLTTLRVAESVPAGPLPIRAVVDAQICKELCVIVKAEAALELAVKEGAPSTANQKLFEEAREALPRPLAEAPYIRGSTVEASPETITLDEGAEIIVTIRVQRGHYIQDRNPGNEMLIPSRLYIEEPEGIKLGEPRWPEPKVKENEVFGRVRTQSGEVRIRVPVEVIDRDFPSGDVPLRVLFSYQCCAEAGTCYPGETAEALVTLKVDTPNDPPAHPLGSQYPRILRGDAASAADGAAASGPESTRGGEYPVAAAPIVRGLWWYIAFAFLGGFILNITPCVFPVISLKILSFVKQAGDDRLRVLMLGITFCAGIMAWFWLFAWITSVGQIPLQNPIMVIGLIAILVIFALNLFGVFEIMLPGPSAGTLDAVAGREGYTGAFFKGFLATLLGTACTAPFFGAAIAWAATQPPIVSFTVFSAAGAGMAFPYLVLSAFPAWLKLLPKPGPWMVTFKQSMGFVLLLTAVWLVHVLGKQLDTTAVAWTLAFLTAIGFAAWLIGRIALSWSALSKLTTWAAALLIIVAAGWASFVRFYDLRAALAHTTEVAAFDEAELRAIAHAVETADWSAGIPWQPFKPGLPEALAKAGYTVYVDFTATWCLTCHANKASSVEIASTIRMMRENRVIPIKADFTRTDPAIYAILMEHGRNSVPLNLVYAANRPDSPQALPAILTPGIVHDALNRAGATVAAPIADPTATAARTPR